MYNEIVNCVVMKHYDPLISSDKLYTPDQTIQPAQERTGETRTVSNLSRCRLMG